MAPKHTIAEAYQLFFQNLFNFNGRTRRSDYWRVVIINSLVVGVISGIFSAIFGAESTAYSIISYIISLAVFVLELALAVRRLHDTGKEWTYILLSLIPFVGWIIMLIQFCKDSEPGDNQFGPNPKGVAGNTYQAPGAPVQPYAAPAQPDYNYAPPQPAQPVQPAQPYVAPAPVQPVAPAEAPAAQPYVAPAAAPEPVPAPAPVAEPVAETAAPAYCASCGSPLPLGSNNCPNCGAKVN